MHIPVMLNEVIHHLNPQSGETFLDCTFGAGGYSKAILERGAKILAVDRDHSALEHYQKLHTLYKDKIHFLESNFDSIFEVLNQSQMQKFDGIVMDLGVSSMQLDSKERGFSFMRDGPLDMRMNQAGDGITAANVVNSMPEEALADIIFQYGDERDSRKIARAICLARKKKEITTTLELASIIKAALRRGYSKIDPSTKTFQAIRIYVNDEMGSLERFLAKAEHLLKSLGRIVIVTFHSLEDGIVKRYLKENTAKAVARSKYAVHEKPNSVYVLPVKKVIIPSPEEIRQNHRARSAKLRVAIKT